MTIPGLLVLLAVTPQHPHPATVAALVAIGKGDEPGFPHHRHSVERIARFI